MATTDSIPVPRKNVAFRAHFDLRLNTGALNSGAAGLDSEVSKDDGTFADCTNEATEVATSSGHYYLDLTSTEMNADSVLVQIKSTTTNAVTRTLIIHPQETGDIKVDVTSWLGTATPAPDTAGYPKVTVKSGTGTGEISVTSGIASVNTTQVGGNSTGATNLGAAAATLVTFTVDTAGFSPTTTEFETSITEATEDHYNGQVLRWRTGSLAGQSTLVQDYVLTGGRGHLTVVAMTEAPANGDAGVLA